LHFLLRKKIAPALAFLLPLAVWAPTAWAIQYETTIDVETEQDLQDLKSQGVLSDETLQTLLELLDTGVDLNSASRDDLYELPNLTLADVDAILRFREINAGIPDPAQLVAAGAITADQLKQIAPFLLVEDRGSPSLVNGNLRAGTRTALGDTLAPTAFLQARVKGPHGFSGGLALITTRQRLGAVRYDELRQALRAQLPAYSLQVPKWYGQWKSHTAQVVVGSFQLGFGNRLTLDNTSRYEPNGIYADYTISSVADLSTACRESAGDLDDTPCNLDDENKYVTPDFKWRERFRGVAARLQQIRLGDGAELAATGFLSYQSRTVYQYQVFDRGICEDPRGEGDACDAPPVYADSPDPTAPVSRIKFSSLPGAFNELAGGGNLTLSFQGRSQIGLTGYWANELSAVEGIDLGYQEWAPYPVGPYGAAGVYGQTQLGPVDLSLEVTRTFAQSLDGGGGFGLLQRSVLGLKQQELELSFRYFGREFLNPFARPISSSDRFEGLNARNESGVRLRYLTKVVPDLQARALVDFWGNPSDGKAAGSAGTTNLRLLARGDYAGWSFLTLTGWAEYENKDLARGGRGLCYSGAYSLLVDDNGVPLPCAGEFYQLAAGGRLMPFGKRYWLELSYQHTWRDDPTHPEDFRQDRRVWAELGGRPHDRLQIRVRSAFLDQDLGDDTTLETSWWTYAEVSWRLLPRLDVRARYDFFDWLDQREATLARTPNPENRFLLEVSSRF